MLLCSSSMEPIFIYRAVSTNKLCVFVNYLTFWISRQAHFIEWLYGVRLLLKALTTRQSKGFMREKFRGRLISLLGGNLNWHARSPDLTPWDLFLWKYFSIEVFKYNPRALEELKTDLWGDVELVISLKLVNTETEPSFWRNNFHNFMVLKAENFEKNCQQMRYSWVSTVVLFDRLPFLSLWLLATKLD